MSEWIRTHRLSKWGCLAATCAVAIIATGVLAATPQSQKKPAAKGANDQAKKSEVDTQAGSKGTSVGPVVARVNGEDITYKALAEEVIARKGSEVLDTMISRLLVE